MVKDEVLSDYEAYEDNTKDKSFTPNLTPPQQDQINRFLTVLQQGEKMQILQFEKELKQNLESFRQKHNEIVEQSSSLITTLTQNMELFQKLTQRTTTTIIPSTKSHYLKKLFSAKKPSPIAIGLNHIGPDHNSTRDNILFHQTTVKEIEDNLSTGSQKLYQLLRGQQKLSEELEELRDDTMVKITVIENYLEKSVDTSQTSAIQTKYKELSQQILQIQNLISSLQTQQETISIMVQTLKEAKANIMLRREMLANENITETELSDYLYEHLDTYKKKLTIWKG